jgi:low temperature requirement protein LtrA
MNPMPPSSDTLHHHTRRMRGRDPNQFHRVATPLELLFDLTFVIAFGLAASKFAHALAEGHYATALIGFAFASFAISWAWVRVDPPIATIEIATNVSKHPNPIIHN